MNETEETVKIYSCFPETNDFDDLEEFIRILVDKSKEDTAADEEEKWGGFLGKSYLAEALKNKFHDDDDYKKYSPPSSDAIEKILNSIKNSTAKSQEKLQNEESPLRVFVYPWFPNESDQIFRGTMGTAFWANSFHLYIDTNDFSTESLENTVVHEYNHAMYFNHHSPFEQTMLGVIIMEGLAENFRDDVNGGNPSPWAVAIEEKDVKNQLDDIKEYLDSSAENNDLYKEIFYGSGKYKRWIGYSIGYRIVNSFMSSHLDMKWEDLMKLEPSMIIKKSEY